ncbi:hypothetical protein [Paenibacillus qinlingensis]|uniref:Transcription-repair coupling factor (Superfamily II helicase) n=1 Tax=Paenibacillus qinlingensis TaxID=1837343 RepID=A0ABU1P3M4_9BACL|nr:hypothetical protein [Paenibacillus qinlingensis]MDR6554352.1 transcription-repair coupling factor (superfamily II helicase) [Paenibacillus qinlingensis]
MSISPKKKVRIKAKHKVAILLKDHDATAKVYVEILGDMKSPEVMMEAIKRLEDGFIYTDEKCTMLIDSDYIEVYPRKSLSRREREGEDFIFLIDRISARNYVVSAKIIK